MERIPRDQVLLRLKTENVWWGPSRSINTSYAALRRRAYFTVFVPHVRDSAVRRAVLLMGPRRVGKTVMLHHTIQELLTSGVEPKRICYISVDHPMYNGLSLQTLLDCYAEASECPLPRSSGDPQTYVFFDEIQYLRNWEIHLKTLVDEYSQLKFVASGSAAAALRLRSTESGAGRFTDFLLPPLTFHEYLDLLHALDHVEVTESDLGQVKVTAPDINALNEKFVHYLNFGGYPEVLFSQAIQGDPARFVKGDIIDKVLLRDLPSLYGIQDIQELNSLFTTLAFNTANEVSLEDLSQHSGVAKNTIKRYIEYLEAAFLLRTVHRIDRTGRRFQRANYFKVYLTNPSMRAALFAPLSADADYMGQLAETGIFSQWFHAPHSLYYARWPQPAPGEVDIVSVDSKRQKPNWAVEVKWTDRFVERPRDLQSVLAFCHSNSLDHIKVTTKTLTDTRTVDGVQMHFEPASIYCFTIGYNIVRHASALRG